MAKASATLRWHGSNEKSVLVKSGSDPLKTKFRFSPQGPWPLWIRTFPKGPKRRLRSAGITAGGLPQRRYVEAQDDGPGRTQLHDRGGHVAMRTAARVARCRRRQIPRG